MIDTPRIRMHVLFSGPEDGTPVLFIHGNAASNTYWEEIMLKLTAGFRGIAPDLRGYGDTEDKLIDATRGAGDWVDDLLGLMDALRIEKAHVAGHSMGGAIIFSLVAAASDRFLSVTLVNPSSPYGFGGTKDVEGTPCYDDFAGSGGGVVNAEFTKLIAAGDRSTDNPLAILCLHPIGLTLRPGSSVRPMRFRQSTSATVSRDSLPPIRSHTFSGSAATRT
jgi:pimeloyl-ACP methyl ester carboxylesterase